MIKMEIILLLPEGIGGKVYIYIYTLYTEISQLHTGLVN